VTPTIADTARRQVVILGAGGHARVVIDALRSRHENGIAAVLAPDPALHGTTLDGVSIAGDDDRLTEYPPSSYDVVVAVVRFGDHVMRHALLERVRALGYRIATVVHASATVSPRATIGSGVQIMAGAIVNPGAKLGDDVIVNSGAIVEHDCTVGTGAHLAPRVVLGGRAAVGAKAQLGLGCVVLPGLRVGDGAIVGAGAVVTRNVAEHTTVAGVPAHAVTRSESRGRLDD